MKKVVNRSLLRKILIIVFMGIFFGSMLGIVKVFAETDILQLDNVVVAEKADTIDVSTLNHDRSNVIVDATYHALNDYIVYQLTLKNTKDQDYTILDITDDNHSPYLVYEYDSHQNEVLQANGTLSLDVKVSYQNEVSNTADRIQTDDVHLLIKLEGEEEQPISIINPRTSSDKSAIYIYFILLILSLFVLGLLFRKKEKKNTSYLLLLLLLVPISTFALTTFDTVITFKNHINLQDKVVVIIDNDGNQEERVLPYQTKVEEPTPPSKPGYDFVGWYLDNAPFDFNTLVSGDIQLEAKYTPITYQITYELDGGNVDNPTSYNIETNTFTLSNPTKAGYTFKGWSGTDLNGEENVTVQVQKGTSKDLNYSAHYIPNTYTIKFDKNASQATGNMDNQVFTYDTSSPLNNVSFENTGYTFTGWNTKANGSGDAYDNGDDILNLLTEGETTLYAQWSPNSYEIEFIGNHQNVQGSMSNLTMTYDTPKSLTANSYTLVGYTFDSWNTKADGTGESYDNEKEVNNLAATGTVSLYAQWIPNTYEIEFIGNHQNVQGSMSNLTMTYDTPKSLTANSYTLVGYTFDSWNTKADGTGDSYDDEEEVNNLVSTGVIPLYAQWNINQYTITFNTNGGNTINPVTQDYGTSISAPTDPVKENYTFDGWYEDQEFNTLFDFTNATLTGNITLYAKWSASSYEIEFVSNHQNAEGSMSRLAMTYDTPKKLTANSYTLVGYTFNSWNTKADGTGDSYDDEEEVNNLASSGTISLYAQWSPNTYEIEFIGNHQDVQGSMSKLTMTYDTSKNLTTNSYTLTGYTFDSWNTKADGSGNSYHNEDEVNNLVISGTVQLYAQWISNSYEIEFVGNHQNVQGSMSNLSMTYDTPKNLTTNSYTLLGYTFDSWNTKADGSGDTYHDDEEVNNLVTSGTITLYAQWIPNSYEIEFVSNHQNAEGSMNNLNMTYDIPKILTANAFTLYGYTFKSWNTRADGSGDTYNNEVQVNNLITTGIISLYAQWSPNSYEVVFDGNHENVEGSMNNLEMTYNTPKNLTANAFTLVGYTFNSWNSRADGSGVIYNNEEEINNLATSGTITLYAQWTPNEYEIEFIANHQDANGIMNNLGMTYNIPKTLTTNTFTVLGYTFDSWNTKADGTGEIYQDNALVSNLATSGVTQLYAQWSPNTYEIEFVANHQNAQGTMNNLEMTYNTSKNLTDNSYTLRGFAFDSWNTQSDGSGTTYQDKEEVNNLVSTGTITLYAQWIKSLPVDYICKRALTLHSDTCDSTGSCSSAGYTEGGSKATTTIIYGSIAYRLLTSGNAFDCDVNGDGVYDADTERFYYLRTVNNNAVLISHTNFEGENGQGTTESVNYGPALKLLPTIDQWSNVVTTFTNTFDNTDTTTYSARFASYDDISEACGITNASTNGALNDCEYIMENSRFVSSSTGRTGMWLEMKDNKLYRIHTGNRAIANVQNTSNNYARPVIEVPLEYVEVVDETVNSYTIIFDTDGGTELLPIEIMQDTPIGELPTPIKNGYEFDGWYYEADFITSVQSSDTFTENTTLYAKWNAVAVCIMNGTYYSTVSAALNEIKNNTQTTITLIKNVNETITIATSRNIILDLNGYTFTSSNTGTVAAIENKNATLKVMNGTVTTSASGAGAINNIGTLIIDNASITSTGTRQGIYNNGGTLTITGNSLISNKGERAAVQNLNNGTTTILSGTITSTGTVGAVYNEKGTLIIGTKDGNYDSSSPLLQGLYGIKTNTNGQNKIYDGIFKGTTAAVENESLIVDIEDDSVKVNDVEDNYKILYYELDSSQNRITLNANGGSVSPNYLLIDKDSAIGELPTPIKGNYQFEGWYTGLTDGIKITETYIPSGSITIYARYTYQSSDEIVNFNLTNDTMAVYYANIENWKNDESTFQTNMDTNFNNNNCSKCTGPNYQECPTPAVGTNLCDQPKGYDTNTGEELTIRLSNENTKIKGETVSYPTVVDGVIYNMIPGETYYWEAINDSDIYGYVKVNGERRIIYSNVRNVRDLGGLEVDTDNDGIADGITNYGKLYRGAKLSTNTSDVSELQRLGINEEVDLRGSSTDAKLDNYQGRSITNYLIYYDTYNNNYKVFRKALVDTMNDVINDNNVFFHCKIGTDRTGTMAYFLEGLLGVSLEDRLKDYELSYFSGLLNRHRFHDQLDGSSINPRFATMANTYSTNQQIYDWFMQGTENEQADIDLINNFRSAMITSY